MSRARLLEGDALAVLKTLPEESVRCCVTSPPYWGLRDYGTATWKGGSSWCDHDQRRRERDPDSKSSSDAGAARDSLAGATSCRKCGAVRVDAQLGLERTPEEYVARLVEVFREVRRVLTKDGTLWLNLGDSYAGSGKARGNGGLGPASSKQTTNRGAYFQSDVPINIPGCKAKDLVGVPWRVAFALQADGWWLRSDIIWSKPNPMPESVTDRPTRAHEYLFLLSKAARYYYDGDAIAEEAIYAGSVVFNDAGKNGELEGDRGRRRLGFLRPEGVTVAPTRNARSVWEIATHPYPEAHFATFPEELPRRCILAGSAPGDTVLDPFCGSGTTCAVATGNGRGAIGIDLNPKYLELARQRIGPLLCEVA